MSVSEIIELLEDKKHRASLEASHNAGMKRALNKEVEAFDIAIHNLWRVKKYRRQFSDAFVRAFVRRLT